jgi:RNA polymerase sigma-70 factor (ECF subfamily)
MDIAINFSKSENLQLLAACQRKERWAQQRLYETYYSKLMGVAIRYANDKDEALDILHEGFIKIFLNISRYQEVVSLQAWMTRIIVNAAIDFNRRNQRYQTDELDVAFGECSTDADALSLVAEQDILLAIQNLPPIYRTIFNLHIIEGLSYKEIADLLGYAESTCRTRMAKARRMLQQTILEEKYQENEQ